MYNISYFKAEGRQSVLKFLSDNAFALLTGGTLDGYPVATQIPMLMEERGGHLYLQGHIMKKTDHHKAFVQNPKVLAVFTGPDAYVSASWYSEPKMGSTWNYMSVYINGEIRFMTDQELVDFMKRFTLNYEGGDRHSPTVYDNLPESYISKMMPAISGIEIKAEKIDNVFKLSQNRDEESYRNIISKLEERGGDGLLIANEMRKRANKLFPDMPE